jgi:hypothetical protein
MRQPREESTAAQSKPESPTLGSRPNFYKKSSTFQRNFKFSGAIYPHSTLSLVLSKQMTTLASLIQQ